MLRRHRRASRFIAFESGAAVAPIGLASVAGGPGMTLLERINSPDDLKKLSPDELTTLAAEMRTRIFDAVSKNGGHLASNLGVVELTIALHYVFDFGPYPEGPDRLLWDVGHQSYPHKMLTGRTN